jgi:hypothetical protein
VVTIRLAKDLDATRFTRALRVFILAESLGGVVHTIIPSFVALFLPLRLLFCSLIDFPSSSPCCHYIGEHGQSLGHHESRGHDAGGERGSRRIRCHLQIKVDLHFYQPTLYVRCHHAPKHACTHAINIYHTYILVLAWSIVRTLLGTSLEHYELPGLRRQSFD